jgi:hypothetical protein
MIYVIIALFALLAYMVFNTLKMKPEDTGRYEKKTEYDFDRELALKRFQNMLRKKTIWPRDAEPDYGEFRSFLPMLKKDYLEVFKALEVKPFETATTTNIQFRGATMADGELIDAAAFVRFAQA